MPRINAAVALLLSLLARTPAATPTDDLLHLVDPDTTVCVVVRDLRGHTARVLGSPFADWFPGTEFGKTLLSSDPVKKLRETQAAVSTHLGMTAADIRDDVFGDAVVLAYRKDNRGDESGVLLLKARKPDALAKLVRTLNDEQKKSGEVTGVTERTHLGLPYYERAKANGQTEYFFTRDDGVLGFSAQEDAIKHTLFMDDRVKERDGTPKRAFTAAFAKLDVRNAAAVLLFNPRTLDAEFAVKAKESKDANEKAFLTQFGKLWAATEAVGVSLTLDRGAELTVNVAFDPARVPAELKPLFTAADAPTALWSAIPSDALFAVAGRFDVDRLSAVVQSFLSDDGRTGLKAAGAGIAPVIGKDTLPKVATGIGPDWGLWLTAPAKGDQSPLPVVTFALRVRPPGSTDDTVGEAIASGLDFAAQLLRVEYNKAHDDQFTLAEEKADGGRVKALKNDAALPPGVRPAYGLRGDFLVLASNPESVKRFAPPARDAKVSAAPLVRVSASKLREYLTAHRTGLSEPVGKWTGEKAADVEKGFAEFATVLELFDTVELTHTGDGTTTKLALKVETAKPLKK